MAKPITTSQFENPDAAAAALDARLVLILANHIGDLGVPQEAITLAKDVRALG